MSYSIILTGNFKKEAKRLVKKFPSLKQELQILQSLLLKNPNTGTPLANNCYKIRVAIASKGKGKSGGARLITHVYAQGDSIFLLSIYDKSERENLSEQAIEKLLQQL